MSRESRPLNSIPKLVSRFFLSTIIALVVALVAGVPAVVVIRFFTDVRMIEDAISYGLQVVVAGVVLYIMVQRYVVAERAQVPFKPLLIAVAIAQVLFGLAIFALRSSFWASFVSVPSATLYNMLTKGTSRENLAWLYALLCLLNALLFGVFDILGYFAGKRKYAIEKQKRESAYEAENPTGIPREIP